MAKYVYTVSSGQPMVAPALDCHAKHWADSDVAWEIPAHITDPSQAKDYMEENVLDKWPISKVTLYLACQEWVPTTHKRSKQ